MPVLFVVLFPAIRPLSATAQSWSRVTDVPNGPVYAFTEHEGILFATTDSVLYRTLDSGRQWSPTPSQPPSNLLNSVFSHGASFYVGTLGDGAFRSIDTGRTWQQASEGLSGSAKHIVQIAARGESLYAATNGDGIYALANDRWTAYHAGLFQFGATSIAANDSTLVAGIGSYVFARSLNSDRWSFTVIDSSFSRLPLCLFQHDSAFILGTTGGVFRGSPDGMTWTKADISQFPDRGIVAFAADGARLFAGLNYRFEHWIFSTDDGGATWDIRAHEFSELLSLSVWKDRIWAGRADGLWWYPTREPSGIKADRSVPSRMSLYQNYPNPFNPSTTISFQLPRRSRIRLVVLDILGREVSILLDEIRNAGIHSVDWDAMGLPTGIYLSRLEAEGASAWGTLLLVK